MKLFCPNDFEEIKEWLSYQTKFTIDWKMKEKDLKKMIEKIKKEDKFKFIKYIQKIKKPWREICFVLCCKFEKINLLEIIEPYFVYNGSIFFLSCRSGNVRLVEFIGKMVGKEGLNCYAFYSGNLELIKHLEKKGNQNDLGGYFYGFFFLENFLK